MNRLAIFVEGRTGVYFVERLILAMADGKVLIEHSEIRGGGKSGKASRAVGIVRAAKPASGEKYYVLIMDCGSDYSVKSRIQEEHARLTAEGYSRIIGIRDIRPKFTHAEIPLLEAGLPTDLDATLIPVEFVLSIMELEAWFLAEHTHFPRIDANITVAAISAALGFDPENEDMQLRLTPTEDLSNCYAIAGRTYSKRRVSPTIRAVDYEYVYVELQNRIDYLARLIASIEAFLY